ncbi:MAG: cysteine desulfurase [Alphaproteobacteria bacterium]|nr:cysteine desulfurase [Alphaproteobacteria bacterium]MCY4319692.1 cysteine desulfurase [Alphaproteobacteria bacterium]
MSPDSSPLARPNYDVLAIREDFPILAREVFGKPLVYLDTGASAQKPRQVIRTMTEVMEETYSNVHRGVHFLSQTCTDQFEAARKTVARFIAARKADEIVWTRGATEACNLIAATWGRANVGPGDRIVISTLEHHSNIVPWQLLRDETGAELAVIPVDDVGEVDLDAYADLLDERTKLVSVTHISNSIGSVLPIREMARMAHEKGALIMVDGCQAAPHMPVDVQDLDVDFYCFSGHKTYGPTGIGALWGRKELLDAMPPYQGGGEMIAHVTFEKSSFKPAPHKFEAGTPAIVEAVGLGAALDYIESIGREAILAHETEVAEYARERLATVPGLGIVGQARERGAIVSFTMEQAHPHDIGTIVDRAGVAVRAGHHCAFPVMERFDVSATARASFGLYNMKSEVDRLVEALDEVAGIFGR